MLFRLAIGVNKQHTPAKMLRAGTLSLRRRFWCFLLLLECSLERVSAVWPLPQQMVQSAERYALSPDLLRFAYGRDSAARLGCSVLDAAFKRYFSIMFPDFSGAPASRLRNPWSNPNPFIVSVEVRVSGCDGYPQEDSDEGYKLSVCDGRAALTSESVWGALRGLETFSQLVNQDRYGFYYINKTEIVDFPRFPFRGLLLDSSRHYLPLRSILQTLDAMAYSKLNVFHWHIVDDPSFPYQSRTFPDLSNKGAFHPFTHVYTQTDVMRVIQHARMRGIRVVPEFDSPGHTQSWGKGQADLLTPCYKGDVPSGTFGPVNPTLDSTYTFMERLFKEVKTVFPDSYIHLGGDEVSFECWKTNPNVRTFMKKMGFGNDFTKLEAFYMEKIMNITTALNQTSIVWQDVFDYRERIPPGTVLEIWKGETYSAELSKMTLAGHRVLLSAPWYINHVSYGQDWRNSYAVQPQNFSGTEEQRKLVMGGEVAMWGEYVDATNLNPRLWPRACAAAERLWSEEKSTMSADLALPRLEELRCRLLRRGIQAEPLNVGHCKNEFNGL